ncbi:MAG TPA: PAS domain S-box protein [Pyrinomonadaceae bacterium]|jgi:PAS domain S-box-containing protein|nr:PAS domain S-box protein [Pyrinomonadaceae bacterium]
MQGGRENSAVAAAGESAGDLKYDRSNDKGLSPELSQAEAVLAQLAGVFFAPNLKINGRSRVPTQAQIPTVADTYKILVEQIPAVVFIAFFDKSFGEAYVSPQIEAALGFTQEEWLNDPIRWYRQIHPDDKERWSADAARIFLSGEPLVSVYRVLSREGKIVWFHCEVKMVRRADGHPWFIHGVGFDISDLKNAEEALTKSEEMLSGIFENAPDTMIVVNSAGKIERANARVEQIFGYNPRELVGQPVETLVPDHFPASRAANYGKHIADSHLPPIGAGLVLYGLRKDGGEFPIEIMLSPVSSDGGSGNGAGEDMMIAVIRDITRRKKDEEVLREYAERMKVLSQKLIDIQESERRRIALELHDQIGQILTGLKLKLEMLARTPGEESPAQFNEAQEMVNELLFRTRELSLDLRPATLDHLGLLSALLRHLRHYASQTNVAVDFQHDGLEGTRFGPELETAAFRIVQEGLTNIARHAEAEKARVRIWASEHTLTIEIEDNGKGFDPSAAMAVGQSSGLTGMRERAMLLGGEFSVESNPGLTRLTAVWNLSTLRS